MVCIGLGQKVDFSKHVKNIVADASKQFGELIEQINILFIINHDFAFEITDLENAIGDIFTENKNTRFSAVAYSNFYDSLKMDSQSFIVIHDYYARRQLPYRILNVKGIRQMLIINGKLKELYI